MDFANTLEINGKLTYHEVRMVNQSTKVVTFSNRVSHKVQYTRLVLKVQENDRIHRRCVSILLFLVIPPGLTLHKWLNVLRLFDSRRQNSIRETDCK